MNETPETTIATPSAAPEAVETVAAEGVATAGAPRQQPPQQGGLTMFVPMLIILAIFYFMMIRPQQRKEKERRKMIDELKAGKRIVFAGGIIGTIVEATEKTFKVKTASDAEMEILRSCVQGVAE